MTWTQSTPNLQPEAGGVYFFLKFNLHSDGRNKQLKQADEGIYMREMFQGILIPTLNCFINYNVTV